MLLSALSIGSVFYFLASPSVQNSVDFYEVSRGQSIIKVAIQLNELKVLNNIFLTRLFFKIFNLEDKLKAGIYEFNAGDS